MNKLIEQFNLCSTGLILPSIDEICFNNNIDNEECYKLSLKYFNDNYKQLIFNYCFKYINDVEMNLDNNTIEYIIDSIEFLYDIERFDEILYALNMILDNYTL